MCKDRYKARIGYNEKGFIKDVKRSIMDYRMNIDSTDYHIGCNITPQPVVEKRDYISDNKGFNIELNNVFLDDIHLKWGRYESPQPKHYSVSPTNDSVVAHFCLAGYCITQGQDSLNMQRGECVLFKENSCEYSYEMGTDNNQGGFFEISLTPQLYNNLFVGENQLLDRVLDDDKTRLFGNIYANPEIRHLIGEMYRNRECYCGKLKKLYLESKVIELLLLQTKDIQLEPTSTGTKLHPLDIEAIYFVRQMLEQNLQENNSIAQLALSAGINQTKLKQGFKELFGDTVFGYLTKIRMQKAEELLLQGKLPVAEIASLVGYQHAQHFTVAFKKNMGYLPSQVKFRASFN